MVRQFAFFVKLLIVFLFLSSSIFAHSFWLNATAYKNEAGADNFASVIYFGYGYRFPVDDFLESDNLREFNIVTQSGKVEQQTLGISGFLATRLKFKERGLNTVTAATKKGYFTAYIKDGNRRHIFDGYQDLKGAAVIASLYYEQYAKVLIQNGPVQNSEKPAIVGHNIEIVALENPYTKSEGDNLRLQVLFEGKPQSGIDIFATYVGFSHRDDFAFATRTNREGVATIRLLERGQWIVFAIERRPPSDKHGDKKVFEEKYTASLAFYVK